MTHRRMPRRSFISSLGAVAAGVTLGPRLSLGAQDKALNFYNWDTYIGETTLSDFKAASGIEVTMDLFADNDELFAKLKEGNPGYDLIVPTNDYVERMIVAQMLRPVDHGKIKNLGNIDMVFMNAAFDPGRKYSLPYMWGTIGVGYRKSKVKSIPDSWRWLLDSDAYKGRVALLGEAATVFEMVFKYKGHDLNTTDPAHIKEAEELLIRNKPNIKVFAEDNGQDLLASGEVDVVMEWNGDILQVMAEDDDIGFVVPKEGGLLWQDCLCIPNGAPHPENAHAFIDFMLDARNGAAIAETIQYATPNAAAKALMDAAYRENPGIFPPDDVLRVCEASIYKGEEHQRLIDEAWTRVNAA